MRVYQRQVVRRNIQIGISQHHEHRTVDDGRRALTKHCPIRLNGAGGIRIRVNILQWRVCYIQLRNPSSELGRKC